MKDVKDFELTFDGERASLIIREVYLEDSGDYRCVAKNSQGSAETSCRLIVEREFLFPIGCYVFCALNMVVTCLIDDRLVLA